MKKFSGCGLAVTASVTVEHGRADQEQGGHCQPNLPVREQSIHDEKFRGQPEIGGHSPETQHRCHQGGRHQQRRERQSEVSILTLLVGD